MLITRDHSEMNELVQTDAFYRGIETMLAVTCDTDPYKFLACAEKVEEGKKFGIGKQERKLVRRFCVSWNSSDSNRFLVVIRAKRTH